MNKKEFKELDKEQMTSEEIIKECEELIKEINSHKDKDFIGRLYYKNRPVEELLKGLLDLYKQEKEKNKKIKIELEVEKTDNIYNKEETTEETIPKYKIREKIKELEKELVFVDVV